MSFLISSLLAFFAGNSNKDYLFVLKENKNNILKYIVFCLFFVICLSKQVFSQCTHSIALYDTGGDGWNGGTVTVQVSGVDVLTGLGSTFTAGGVGPTFTFSASAGQIITVIRTSNGGDPAQMRVVVYGSVCQSSVIIYSNPTNAPGISGLANCNSATDQTTFGSDYWIGYVYAQHNGNNNNPPTNSFTTPFFSSLTESQIFDRNYGLFGPEDCNTNYYGERFAIRYRMTKNFTPGVYNFTIGADDGIRLSLDGGLTWLISDFQHHGYRTQTGSAYLSGNVNLVLEYYENSGDSRVTFTYGVGELSTLQLINTSNIFTNYSNCSGIFYDSGGANGNYSNNEFQQVTFYPSTPGGKVILTFTDFRTEASYDGMMIYNGNSTGAPLFTSGLGPGANTITCPAGSWRGTTSPGTITSTAADGTLTVVFRSDANTVFRGWVANISCSLPCNTSAPVGAATQTFCSSFSPTIASLSATGSGIKWYNAATGGNPLPINFGLSNGATYFATQIISGCESSTRLAVTVIINPVAVSPTITGNTNLCWNGTTTLTPEYPTGGTITNSGGFRTHTFTSNGTLIVPAGFSGSAQVLVIGGGGGGGSGRGGGGGAGGLLYNSNFNLTAGTSYTVTIGAGGAPETNGSNSVFSTLTAIGGGRGGSHNGTNTITTNNGQNGGSGGGAAINYNTNIFTGGIATIGQGNNGATSGSAGTDNPRNTGGGGGASESGRVGSGGNTTWTTGTSPKGGDGLYFPEFLTTGGSPGGWFAGGGGGSRGGTDRLGAPAGLGGQGGGGAGSATGTNSLNGVAGTPNTGGGGGGGDVIISPLTIGIGGAGGSGIIIVRYYIGTPLWSSQNTSIATVSNGVVTGNAPGGSTTINYTVASVGVCPSTNVSTQINVFGGQQISPLGPQCSGILLNFEALPNPSVSGTTISWTVTTPLPTGLTANTLSGSSNLFSSTFTNTGNLTPEITISQTIGALTCIRNFTPTIIAIPTVSLNCPNFCAGTPIDIIATPTPAGTYTYNWTALPGGVINPENTVNTSIAGTYTVIATNATTNCPSAATSCTIAVQNPPRINAISPP